MAIMDTYTIGGVTGQLIRMIDKDTAVLFDGEKNITVKIAESEKEEGKACTNCKKEQPIKNFKQYKNGNYTSMCNKCRAMVYKANKNPEVKPEPTKIVGEIVKVPAVENPIGKTKEKDVIKPSHYHKPSVKGDLIDSWHLVMPMNEFRASMKTHIAKYVFRYNEKNGIEDLDKAIEFIERLKEKEMLL